MIRKPAVAGMFYPAQPQVLADDVDAMLSAAAQVESELGSESATGDAPGSGQPPRAVIVPHAGYVYSGSTAALAYARLAAVDPATIEKVVIVGPTHRVAVHGIAYPSATGFGTPLGEMPIWPGTADALADLPFCGANDLTHLEEHAIEVQLPFLQRLFGDVPIVPLNAGMASGEQVADAIDSLDDGGAQVADGRRTLIVISSDLSHYLPYDTANAIDTATIGQILQLDGPLDHEQACGATPINGILELAKRRGWRPTLLGACNSGDGVGDKQRVVGYCAVEFDDGASAPAGSGVSTGSTAREEIPRLSCEGTDDVAGSNPLPDDALGAGSNPLPDDAGPVLLAHARAAVREAFGMGTGPLPDWPEWANKQFGTFVTLTQPGPRGTHELRGCIGTLSDARPLRVSVADNAGKAAFGDPRFAPLQPRDLPHTRFEVSVLSDAEPMDVHSEAEAIAALRPGVDGVILSDGYHHATFLPQVWDELPDPKEFLQHLRMKAGLPAKHWGRNTNLQRYTVQAWEE